MGTINCRRKIHVAEVQKQMSLATTCSIMAPKTRLTYLAGYQIARDDFEAFIKSIRKSLGEDTIPEQGASFCFLAYDSLQVTIIPQLPNAHCLSLILSSVRSISCYTDIYGSKSLGPDPSDNFSYISSVLLVVCTAPCTLRGQKQDPPQETEQTKAIFAAVKRAIENTAGGVVDESKFRWHWVKKSMKV